MATNFEAQITTASINNGAILAKTIDGDRQLWLRVDGGTVVSIPGAESERFLLFDRAGVFVNVRSLTAAADRISGVPLHPDLNPRASPVWYRLTKGHSYQWHEHRLHALEPLARGIRAEATVGRWSVPMSVDGQSRPLEGDLVYTPPGHLWPWLLLIGALAVAIWIGVAVSPTPASGLAIAAALSATFDVWILRIGRELYGRPEVNPADYVQIGLTSAVGILLLCGLLQRNGDLRVVTALLVGFGGIYEGLMTLRVLTHSTALTALPTPIARIGVAAALGLGAGLLSIVLRGTPAGLPRRHEATKRSLSEAMP